MTLDAIEIGVCVVLGILIFSLFHFPWGRK